MLKNTFFNIGKSETNDGKNLGNLQLQISKELYIFISQMNYYLAGEEKKKSQLVKSLNKYAKDKSVENLAEAVMKILETPVQRKLISTIK